MDERIERKIDEHDRSLVEIQTILKNMADSQNKMADNMSSMTQAIGKIDLWLEKITNLDGNTKESFKRSYRVIQDMENELEEKIKKLEEKTDKALQELEVARFFSKYPKLLIMVIVGFCVLNIEPIRKIIFGG